MATKGELLKTRYLELQSELTKYMDASLFPSLEIIDLTDLCFFLSSIFVPINTDEEYTLKIRELARMNSVEIQEEKVIDLVIEFVKFFKTL